MTAQVKCSSKFKLTKPGVVIDVGLSPTSSTGAYEGDGISSVTLYDFELLTLTSSAND